MVATKHQMLGVALMTVGTIAFVMRPMMSLSEPPQSVASQYSGLVTHAEPPVLTYNGATGLRGEDRAPATSSTEIREADAAAAEEAEAAAKAEAEAAKGAAAAHEESPAIAEARKKEEKARKEAERKEQEKREKKEKKEWGAAAAKAREDKTAAAASVSKCKFDDICKLEKAHKYEEAFAAYEERMEECGDYGWEVVKDLGEGMSGGAKLQKTPCGLMHAAKQPPAGGNSIGSETMLRDHIYQDCFVLKHLSQFVDKPDCDGCFPRYLYHSQKTGTCYNEFIDSTPLEKFIKAQNLTTTEGVNNMKQLFLQAFDALEIMKAENLVHRDLQAQNMLVRNHPAFVSGSPPEFKLVVMDFCWSNWEGAPKKFSTSGRKLGRFTRAADWEENGDEDTYALACAVADIVFMSGKEFKEKDKYRRYCLPKMEVARTDKASLEYVIWRMTQQKHANREHSIPTMREMVAAVKHIRAIE